MVGQQPLRVIGMARNQHVRVYLVHKILHLTGVAVAEVIFAEEGYIFKPGALHNAAQVGICRVKLANGRAVCMQVGGALAGKAEQL